MKILVVDDSKTMRMMIIRSMRQCGFGDHTYIEAENGARGLEKVKSDSPDVVLSDWNMPEMDGGTFFKNVREAGFKMPFGFITTEGTPEMRIKLQQAGANFILEKPFTQEQIEAALGDIVKG